MVSPKLNSLNSVSLACRPISVIPAYWVNPLTQSGCSGFSKTKILDSYKVFYRMFEAPILKSRAPNCTPKEHDEGGARAEQVDEVVSINT